MVFVVVIPTGGSSEVGLATAELSREKEPMFDVEPFVRGGRADI